MISTDNPIDTGPALSSVKRHRRSLSRTVSWALILSLAAIDPVAAQESAVCGADRLPEVISGFFQLTTGIGLIGLVVVW